MVASSRTDCETISNFLAYRPDRDNWRSVLAAILLAKAAVATFSMAPFLLGSYVDYVGLSTRQASQVLSVEIFSIALQMYAQHCSGFIKLNAEPGR